TLGIFGDQRHSDVLRQTNRHHIARMLDPVTQRGRTVKTAFVIFWPPDAHARPLVNLNRGIEHDGRRRISIVERGCVDEGFERRTGLPQRLSSAIELALVVGKTPDHGEDTPGPRVFYDHGSRDFRNLLQSELAVGVGQLHVDDVARIDHLAYFGDRLATAFGPLHSLERKNPDRAFFADKSPRLTSRLQANAGRLVGYVQHDR